MDDDVGKSPDGTGKMSVKRNVQSIVPIHPLILQTSSAEIQSILKVVIMSTICYEVLLCFSFVLTCNFLKKTFWNCTFQLNENLIIKFLLTLIIISLIKSLQYSVQTCIMWHNVGTFLQSISYLFIHHTCIGLEHMLTSTCILAVEYSSFP